MIQNPGSEQGRRKSKPDCQLTRDPADPRDPSSSSPIKKTDEPQSSDRELTNSSTLIEYCAGELKTKFFRMDQGTIDVSNIVEIHVLG